MPAINNDLLTINGEKVVGIKTYRIASNLLWSDADRNMNGDVRATSLGAYPKIELEFRDGLTQAQIQKIYQQLPATFFTVTFWHSGKGQLVTAQYYRSDMSIELLDKNRGLYKAFSVNLIPVSRGM